MKLDADHKARLVFAALVLLAAVAATGWYLFSSSQSTTYEIITQEAVSGLMAAAPAEYHGVEIGKVKSVELIDSRSVRILMSIERTAPITAATAATITTRGLAARGYTGYVYVALEDVGSDSRKLAPRPGERYAVIPVVPQRPESLDVSIRQMSDNVQFLTDRVHEVLDDKTVGSLKQSVENLSRVTKTLADNNARLNTLIVNSEQASHRFRPLVDSTNDTVKALQTQILPETHRALTSLDDAATRLSALAAKVERDPSVVVRGAARPPPGPGEKP